MEPIRAQASAGRADPELAQVLEGIRKAVTRVCPPWLSDRRDDLAQTAMIRVMRILEKERQEGEGNASLPASYLKRVAYTVTIDEIRRIRARPETSVADAPELPTGVGLDPEGGTLGAEIGRAIRDCLRRLVDSRRHAVTLHLLGHSVPESAQLLAWAPKKTENLVYRGLADLRRCLSTKGVAP